MKQFLNLFRFVLHICDTEVMAGDLFRETKVLDLFQLNVLNSQISSNISIIQNKFRKRTLKYPTNLSPSNQIMPPFSITKYK